jgi:UDP-arabinose 4-epimerase
LTAILVTGGAGYIGSHACKALARAGFQPVTYDSLINGHERAVCWGPLVKGDIADRQLLTETLRRFDIAAVMHFAAFLDVGESMREPLRYFQNNVTGSLTLFAAMAEAGVPHIVFSSTCAVYGTPARLPLDESHPQAPVNAYGASKLMVEQALRWIEGAHGLTYAALRYFNAAGADPDGEIGEDHHPETHLIPVTLQAALGLRPAIQIYGTDWPTPDGTCVRDYIHVTDLADAHVKALQHLLGGGASLVLNLGTGRGNSVRDVIDAVERVTGRAVPRHETDRRAGDPPILVADPAAARSALGWAAVHSDLDAVVGSAWRWMQRLHT